MASVGSEGKLLQIIADGVSGGGSGTGPAVTIANGADVVEGSTTDAAVSTDANGTINAHIRGLIVLIVNLLSRWPASLGAKTAANSLAVVNVPQGVATLVTSQVTSGAAATLVAARPTRRSVTIRNTDTANGAYVGPATVTSGNGFLIPAGQSITLTTVGLIQCLAAAGTPVLHCADEFD